MNVSMVNLWLNDFTGNKSFILLVNDVRSIQLYPWYSANLIFRMFFYLNNSNLSSSSYQDVCIMEESCISFLIEQIHGIWHTIHPLATNLRVWPVYRYDLVELGTSQTVYYCILLFRSVWLVNPLRAKFLRWNINLYLHFISLPHIDMTQVLKILPQVRPGPTYFAWSISWLLMSWWRK